MTNWGIAAEKQARRKGRRTELGESAEGGGRLLCQSGKQFVSSPTS